MKKLLIIQVAGLNAPLDIDGLRFERIGSVFPAVTCTVQASFRTASAPSLHGMVANGLFSRRLRKPFFWEQSSRLVEGRRIWDDFRSNGGRVGMLFWQQSLGESVDLVLSPAPIHKHCGGMIQGCYSRPADLYRDLCLRIGRPFKLHRYWGPMASSKTGDWIASAAAAVIADPEIAPDLCLTYLPTLDYSLQRDNPTDGKSVSHAFRILRSQISLIRQSAEAFGYELLIFGDYNVAPVEGAALPNLSLRNAGLMSVRDIRGMLYPDFYGSRAFAMVDHEIAHVFIADPNDIERVQKVLSETPGIGEVVDKTGKAALGLDHENSGELILVAQEGRWLAYPWWERSKEAPDYAAHVDIHNKPGYDPCELFFGWPPGTISRNTGRIRGSHGRTDNGRDTIWGSTISSFGKPETLIELAQGVKSWLDGIAQPPSHEGTKKAYEV
jgi:predicted AlkP superfamily pyrophosphatase or phosphodiesterase